jgi:hypothetical protein
MEGRRLFGSALRVPAFNRTVAHAWNVTHTTARTICATSRVKRNCHWEAGQILFSAKGVAFTRSQRNNAFATGVDFSWTICPECALAPACPAALLSKSPVRMTETLQACHGHLRISFRSSPRCTSLGCQSKYRRLISIAFSAKNPKGKLLQLLRNSCTGVRNVRIAQQMTNMIEIRAV